MQALTARRGGRVVVEAITKVQSVDLVADPATTRGLFESRPGGSEETLPGKALGCLSADDLKRDYPELVESLCREQAAEVNRLQAEVDCLRAEQAAQQKHRGIRRLLHEFNLPEPEAADPQARLIVSDRFLESLRAAPSEQAMRELVEERARLVRSLGGAEGVRAPLAGRPLSRDQHLAGGAGRLDAKTFVEAIT